MGHGLMCSFSSDTASSISDSCISLKSSINALLSMIVSFSLDSEPLDSSLALVESPSAESLSCLVSEAILIDSND